MVILVAAVHIIAKGAAAKRVALEFSNAVAGEVRTRHAVEIPLVPSLTTRESYAIMALSRLPTAAFEVGALVVAASVALTAGRRVAVVVGGRTT